MHASEMSLGEKKCPFSTSEEQFNYIGCDFDLYFSCMSKQWRRFAATLCMNNRNDVHYSFETVILALHIMFCGTEPSIFYGSN